MKKNHILFAVDFSEHCTAIAGYVQALTRGTESRLTLLHVMEPPRSWSGDAETTLPPSFVDLAGVTQHTQDQLNTYLDRELHNVAPLRLLSKGDPATEIVQFAVKEDVNLIMMPTRGWGAFRRLLLGSVTAKVLHDAPCPVWTSSHTEHPTPSRYPFRSVVCAVDLSDDSEETIRWASRFAAEQNAALHVVHAIHESEESTNPGVVQVRRYLIENARNAWQQLQETLGLSVPLHIAYGSAGDGVRKAAHDLQADIVIIGRRHLQERLGRLRTSSYAIIRESPCPVISV